MRSFHVITDEKKDLDTALDIIREIRDYVDYIHIREKTRPAGQLYQWTQHWMKKGVSSRQIIINDRVDVALSCGAGGIQLSTHSLPIDAVKKIVQPGILLGRSVHSLEEARQAEAQGAGYLLFGHIFKTDSKPGVPPRGLKQLKEIVDTVSIPVVAIGGITLENLPSVLKTGCSGVAVISSVMSASSPINAAQAFFKMINEFGIAPRVPWPFDEEKRRI